MSTITCPLCACPELHPSWLNIDYDGESFRFVECRHCQSLICRPMPSEATLAKMYDSSYCEDPAEAAAADELSKFDQVISVLGKLEPGTFLDYGCGDGKLLRKVQSMGWNVIGVDFNPELSEGVQADGIKVFGVDDEIALQADVVHLGDVLEHLTDLPSQFLAILKHLKAGGLLIAHGPLEGNPNLFFKAIRLMKKIKGNRPTEMPPYHVILATTEGQQMFFRQAGLVDDKFLVSEIAFPAPQSLRASEVTDLRKSALYVLRKLSQSVSKPETGNRFFYVGRKP